ncbi:MAG: C_GCAxxG_C_C family protein [Acidobacteria bacterium]|nr:C_GCAxxG_C_C family protein [Acidobacteriota bacterium]
MNRSQSKVPPRRGFLVSAPFFLTGAPLLGAVAHAVDSQRKGVDLPEDLTVAESETVNGSDMARDLANFFGKGYSCAESIFLAGARYLKKPEELVWIAGGFGGGMQHRDLCGFLTGGVMILGLHAGTLQMDRKAARGICAQKVKEYWSWWVSDVPLHCAEIREGRKDYKVCYCLGRLAAAKVEELIKSA